MTALLLLGCGSSTQSQGSNGSSANLAAEAHPQVVQPVPGSVDPGGTPVPQPAGGTPRGPASATSRIAPGAPSDAEVRAEIARFQAAVKKYHLDQLNLSGDLINPADLPPGQWYESIASVFTDYGSPLACGGTLQVPELGVANKTLPCGTMVTFLYNGRAIRVPVIDRGPYIAGREWDLTGATAEALGFPGLGPIYWRLG